MINYLRPYNQYKESGQAWLGQVPSHWKILPNRAIFSQIVDRGHKDEQLLSVTILRGVIQQSSLLEDTSKKDGSNLNKSAYKLVCSGDIAYNKMRAWQGAIGISRYRGLVSPAYVVIRLRDQENQPEFFHYLYRTANFAKEAERWSYGITSDMWSLRPEHFRMIYTVCPPPQEQLDIIRFLNWSNARIEKAIRAKKKLIRLLDEQKQAIIHRAITRGIDPTIRVKSSGVAWIGEIPDHWEAKRLKWVTMLQRGYDLPADKRIQGEFPVISSGGVIDTHAQARAKGPGVVLGRYGSAEAVFYVESDFWPHNTSLFVKDFHGNIPKWCYFLLRVIPKGDQTSKSAVPGVDRKDLFDIVVPLPPIEEQRAVVDFIERATARLNSLTAHFEHEITLLLEYRVRLIADVVTGKLDVREVASHLPAETLPFGESIENDDLINDVEIQKGADETE